MKRTLTVLMSLLLIGGAGARLSANAASVPRSTPASDISIDEQREITLERIRILSLSPDGTLLVGVDEVGDSGGRELCTYDIESLKVVACASVDNLDAGLRYEDVAWSPDSSRIAFAENAFIFFRDSDIWVMDARTGQLTDLTDEGITGKLPILNSEGSDITEFFLDLSPSWSADSQSIAFSRTSWRDGDWRGNTIEVIPATGGETETVIQVSDQEPGVVYWGIRWQADGSRLFYNLNFPEISNRKNGIWVVNRDGSNNQQIAGETNPDLRAPAAVQVTPDGKHILGLYVYAIGDYSNRGPYFTVINVDSGLVSDVLPPNPDAPEIAFVSVAALSPDGSKLLTVTRLGETDNEVYIQDVPDGEPVQLTSALPAGAGMIALGLIPTWATNGSVFVTATLGVGTLLTLNGGEEQPIIASPIALSTPVPTTPRATGIEDTEFAPGATVYVNDDGVRLRAAPSRDAQTVLAVDRGTTLTVIGESVERDSLVWWPVVESTSKTIGWVRAELISLTEEE